MEETKMLTLEKCLYCGSKEIVKHGIDYDGRQKYRCKKCHRQSIVERAGYNFKMKNKRATIEYALELFKTLSYRDIAIELKRTLGVKVTHATVWKWVERYYIESAFSTTVTKIDGYLDIPCFSCFLREELKARTCNPIECMSIEQWLSFEACKVHHKIFRTS